MKRTILLAISVSILTVLATQLALGIPLRQGASAQIPEIISYQGLLNDENGTPLSGNYELTVRIYNQESEGSHLWEETHAGVPVSNGLFNVLLGSVTPLTVAFDEPYYMGLSINGGDELTPRLPFTSVATAFVAKVAYTLAPDADGNITLGGNVDVEGKIGATEYCDENGANCVTTNELARGKSMVEGWPDAIICGGHTFNNGGTETYFIDGSPYNKNSGNVIAGDYVYRSGIGGNYYQYLIFKPDGTYRGRNTNNSYAVNDCNGKSISELYAEGKAFNLVSGADGSADGGDSVPSGAVMPFNLSSCPSGWSALESAQGRFVIGVGSDGEGQSYALADVGGEAFHQLTIDEMPSHTHDARSKHFEVYGSGGLGASHGETPGKWDTGATGGDQPHENRPPYVALLYCEKD